MLLSSMAGSSLGSNESAIAGHSNGMTKKASATFVLSLPKINLELRFLVGPLSLSVSQVKIDGTSISFERRNAFVHWCLRARN